jgi:hypothetical protein
MKIRISEKIPLLLLLISFNWAQAQITSPVIRGKFGVDADVESLWFMEAPSSSGGDDWYHRDGYSGSSVFVIDTTGAGVKMDQYSYGIGLTTPFYRKMRYPAYTSIGTRTLIDAIFVRDYHGSDTTVFALGSNKNGQSPADWACPDAGSVPNKNDILDSYVHVRREGPSGSDTLWMFGGLALEATNGNRYFDFELYQTDIFYTRSTHQFTGYGPDAGHTSWKFDASGNVTQVGDIIFSAEYGSSTLTSIEARIWIDKASLLITPTAFSWVTPINFDGATSGSQYGYASIKPKTADPFYFGTTNESPTWAGPFGIVRANDAVLTAFQAGQFMEFGVNMSVLGLNPTTLLGVTDCGIPFSKILIKTRASTSFTAELKDFIGPFDLFLPPQALAAPDIPMFCGNTIGVSNIDVINPYSTSKYTWTTPDGHIASANADSTGITVDQVGTYIVTQRLASSCPDYASDTVVIIQDPTCTTLASNDVLLNGSLTNNIVNLNWSVTQNQDVQFYTIERSTDGIHFTLVDTVNNPYTTLRSASFRTTDNIRGLNSKYVYYRVKVTRTNGVQYSKIIRIPVSAGNVLDISLQPNPVRDHLQINMYASADREVQVLLYTVTGQLVKSMNTQVKKGYNTLSLNDFRSWARGLYTIKVLSGNDAYVDRIVLIK